METETDLQHLRRALELAARGPAVDPNPRVGAVIVDAAGRVVGEGWHCGAGTPHAESMALAAAEGLARGGTAYVSLEPCRHTGRTPPCTRALIAAGIARVVFAQTDPNPLAAGGAAELRAAGLQVATALGAEAEAINEAWTFAVRHGRPRVIWKTATTLDGRSAAADGTSQWITSPEARAEVHRLRAACGAILVGTGTALADNPKLTVRGIEVTRQPLRVVLGERELPDDLATHPLLHLRHRDPARALAELHSRGVRQVLLEGGSTLATAFLRAGLVDRVVWHLAPTLLGAGPALGDFGVGTLADALPLTIESVHRAGPDLIATAAVRTTPIRKEQGCSQG
ncbi:bifunctional diaminohydroxyphosphoribosylaminopyrimidine deaminase/5-amino-6-(5-phosphoribosylamino)uracil reductase RibD [Ammonicoccus fulvus]|uniref:Riboflavin biosynthesis protein RibD n=1 Tax=Ammonicoccus fulvus TaxID=3138240 RepID=A0ABZ3FQI5_9ACTN